MSEFGSELAEYQFVEFHSRTSDGTDDASLEGTDMSSDAGDSASDAVTAGALDSEAVWDGWGEDPELVRKDNSHESTDQNVAGDAAIRESQQVSADNLPNDLLDPANPLDPADDFVDQSGENADVSRQSDRGILTLEAVEQARQDVLLAYEQPDVGVAVEVEGEVRHPDFVEVEYSRIEGTDALGFEGGGLNETVKVEMTDGQMGYFKSAAGEMQGAGGRGDCIPDGSAWKREIAAYEVDSLIGFDVVPETIAVNDPTDGPGSLQRSVPFEGLDPSSGYSGRDIDRMAVLDYVCGNTDRHSANLLTQADGRPAAIDNGYSFPTSQDVPIKSDFVAQRIDTPLSEGVLTQVRAVDSSDLLHVLEKAGIESAAITGAVDRFEEIRITGRIGVETWAGSIVDASNRRVRP